MTDFKAISKNYLKGFAKALISLLRRKSYDLVVAPANPGSSMIVFAEIATQAANLNLPRTLILPVFNANPPHPPYDNDTLIPKIRANPALDQQYQKILFLDDEISNGVSFVTCMRLLKLADKLAPNPSCTIIAEGNGFFWDYQFAGIQTDFLPYAIRPNLSWHDLIFNMLPDHILADFQDRVDMRLSPKDISSLLFGLPLKDLSGNDPFLNYELLDKADKNLKKLREYQTQWLEQATHLIADAVLELEAKEKAQVQRDWILGRLLLGY